MRTLPVLALGALLLSLAPAIRAADCADIAAATVAELRAGAESWNGDLERLARQAAGAACVKARSTAAPAGSGGQTSRAAAASAAGKRGEAAGEPAAAVGSEDAAASPEDEEGRSGFWPSLKRNDVSGLPGKKPYQRKERD